MGNIIFPHLPNPATCECVDCVKAGQRLVDKLLGGVRTKEFQPLHTASDLADARRAGYEQAREKIKRYICTTHYHEDDLLAFIAAMTPDAGKEGA